MSWHVSGSSLGPSPASKRTERPSACGTTRMSENRIAASKPKRRTGCSVTSAANSGVKHSLRKPPALARTSRYSGKYRPACRIIQTGGADRRPPERTSSRGLLERKTVNLRFHRMMTSYLVTFSLTRALGQEADCREGIERPIDAAILVRRKCHRRCLGARGGDAGAAP